MSYYKTQNLSIDDKKLKITYRIASNNVTPIGYETITNKLNTKEEFYKELRNLFYDIINRSIQFNTSCYKWNYIIDTVENSLKEKYSSELKSYGDEWDAKYKLYKNHLDEYINLSMNLYKEKHSKVYLQDGNYYLHAKVTSCKVSYYLSESPEEYDYYKALYICEIRRKNGRNEVDMINVA